MRDYKLHPAEVRNHDWKPIAVFVVIMLVLLASTIDWQAGIYGPW